MDFENKLFGVFGLGKAGQAAVNFLNSRNAQILTWDDNINHSDDTHYRDWPWGELEVLVLSPGVPLTRPQPHDIVTLAQANNCQIICDIDLLQMDNLAAKYIGITGTNGKSTVTALIGHIAQYMGLDCAVGGNIGVAASSLPRSEIYILETSSYQLDLIDKVRFDIAVLLNITPDHLDHHGGMGAYINAKKKIFKNQSDNDYAIIAVDDDICAQIYQEISDLRGNIIAISGYKYIAGGISICDNILHDDINNIRLELGDLPSLQGQHNQQNIAASYGAIMALCKATGQQFPKDKIIEYISNFKGLEHRLKLINEFDNVQFVNDSKATNDVATRQALLAYDNIYWIAGGVAKSGGIESLEPLFKRVKHVFLIGQAEDEFACILEGKLTYSKCGDLNNALAKAYQLASSQKVNKIDKSVILLSPACASFDQYQNFEQRGNDFIQIVSNLECDSAV